MESIIYPPESLDFFQMSYITKVSQMFRDGSACSQAILVVYGEPLGLSPKLALQLSAGFAGGMRLGETCGAVTGAIMVLGLRHASEEADKQKGRTEVNNRVLEFAKKFRERNGSVVCRDLLQCDISTEEGMRLAIERNLFKTTCVKMVEDAAEILEEMGSR